MAETHTNAGVKNELRHLADRANVERDLWNAFGLLQDKLGPESYRATIRRALKDAERAVVPPVYRPPQPGSPAGVLSPAPTHATIASERSAKIARKST